MRDLYYSGWKRAVCILVFSVGVLICAHVAGNTQRAAKNSGSDRRIRVVVMTDFPPLDAVPGGAGYGAPEKRSDTDDLQSMVRFLMYTNDFDVEGLVATSGTFANIARKTNIMSILDAYSDVYGNLHQHDAHYPSPAVLKSITWEGASGTYGKPAREIMGEGRDSEASNQIVRLLAKPDTRPIWFCVWGGTADLAQAIWRIQSRCTAKAASEMLSKIRIYSIGLQDGTGQWLLDTFPEMFIIASTGNYMGMFNSAVGSDHSVCDLDWVNKYIRTNHGKLGQCYPRSGFYPETPGVWEGDTPSVLYLISANLGLNDPEMPNEPSWGGRFQRVSQNTNHWIDAPGGAKNIWMWREAFQNDFAARMECCVTGAQNTSRPPQIALRCKRQREVTVGDVIELRASVIGGRRDNIVSRWRIADECLPLSSPAIIDHADSCDRAVLHVPNLPGTNIRILLEATATRLGQPTLTRYEYVKLTIKGIK